MGYTNKTSHYDLPQWIAGDKPSWLGDVNTAMLNIDTAIAGADASASAAESSAAAANAQVQAQEAKITKNTTDIQGLTESLAETQGEVNNIKTTAEGAVPLTGGTMTGALILNGAPATDLQAATKKYVDDKAANLGTKDSAGIFSYGDGTATGYAQFNSALALLNIFATVKSSITHGISLDDSSYTFVPLCSISKNIFNLTAVASPTTTAQLFNCLLIAIESATAPTSYPDVYAYYDGSKTYIGLRVASTDGLASKKYIISGGVLV